MANRQNKQRFIFMLREELTKKNCAMHHASGDADLLIVQKAVQSAMSCNTVLVGDDTYLLVLLCYNESLESHDLLFALNQRKTQTASHMEHQGYEATAWIIHMPAHPLCACSPWVRYNISPPWDWKRSFPQEMPNEQRVP